MIGVNGELEFDGFDTSKASVAKQLEYLGSYISMDLKQPRLKGSLSMNKMSKRKNPFNNRAGALQSECEFETLSSFPLGQSSNILPVLDRSDLRIDKQLGRGCQPIREKIFRDIKPVDLQYDSNYNQVSKRTVLSVPTFKKTMPRGSKLPGMSSGMIDPTGHGFIDEASLGLEN